MYLCRVMTDTSLKAIGAFLFLPFRSAFLGGKYHASVTHGIKKIEAEIKTDEALHNTVNIIMKKINPL